MSGEPEEEYKVPVQVWMTWWAPLLGAAFFFAVSYWQWWELGELEAGRKDSVMMSRSNKSAYESGGRGEVVGMPIMIGVVLVGLGLYRVIKDRRGTT